MGKCVAVVFILLLAGHEAVRTRNVFDEADASAAADDDHGQQEQHPKPYYSAYELDFQKENHQCTWSTLGFGCRDEDGKCKWRRLPMDWPAPASSQSCRLTDDYMLQPANRAKYFKLAAGVLSAKSKKFAQKCKGSSWLYMTANGKCKRRAKQMMRAMKVVSKAQTAELVASLSEAEKAEEKARFEAALDNLAEATGEEGSMVLELQRKLKANTADVKRDPKGTVTAVIATLNKLLKGTEAEKEEARAKIHAMKEPDEVDTLSEEEERELDKKNIAMSQQLDAESEANTLVDQVDTVAPDDDASGNDGGGTGSGSLVEVGSGSGGEAAVNGIAFVLTVMLVIIVVVWAAVEILAAVVLWAFIALLGCALWAEASDSSSSSSSSGGRRNLVRHAVGRGQVTGQAPRQRVGLFGTVKCFAKAFAFPFIVVGTAALATYRFFWGVRQEPGSSYLQLEEPLPLAAEQLLKHEKEAVAAAVKNANANAKANSTSAVA